MNWSILIGFLVSLLVSWQIIPVIIKMANKKKWFDIPNERKVHQVPVPPLGGVAIFISFWFALICFNSMGNWTEIGSLFLASILLFIAGLKDDLQGLSAIFRLIIQILVASICYWGGIRIFGIADLIDFIEITPWLDYLCNIFIFVLIINATNLIDGINGLAGSLSLAAFLIFAWLFTKSAAYDWAVTALFAAGTIIGFLKFNFKNAKIFLGDNGSTFLGLLLAVFIAKYSTMGGAYTTHAIHFLCGMSIVCLPAFDLVRVSITRLLQGRSPFSPDKIHIHHILLSRGKNHLQATLQLFILQVGLFFMAQLLLQTYSISFTSITLFIIYMIWIEANKISIAITAIKHMEQERMQVGLLNLPKSEK